MVTALGVAYLAGLAVGSKNPRRLQEKAVIEREFRPGIETLSVLSFSGWKKAVKRALAWEEHDGVRL